TRFIVIGLLAASVAAAAVLTYLRMTRDTVKAPADRQAIGDVSHPAPLPAEPAGSHLRKDLEARQREVLELKEKLATAESHSRQLDTVGPSQQGHQDDQSRYQQLLSEKQTLEKQFAAAQSDLQSLRDKLASAQANTSEQTARVTALETRVNQLSGL